MKNNAPPSVIIISEPVETEVTLVDSAPEVDALRRIIAEHQAPIGIDTETTGLNPHADRLRLLSIALGRKTFVLDADKVHPGDLLPVLHEKDLVLHNGLFDLSFIRRYHPTFGTSAFDTMLASQLLDAGLPPAKGQHSLASLCDRLLDVRLDKSLQTSEWSGPLSEEQVRYAGLDAAITLPLLHRLREDLAAADLVETAELENRCLLGVVSMAMAGVPFDEERWIHRFAEDVRSRDEARVSLEGLACENGGEGINWNSVPQVKRFFAGRGIALANTQRDTLARVADPVASALVSYRAMESAVSRYGPDFAPVSGGRIFPSWHQNGAASGRMSCSKPNLQAMPRDARYRSCIHAQAGHALVAADLSQIELRIAAKISGDAGLRDAFQRGEDLHSRTAQSILGKTEVTKEERQLAKALVFGLLFGMGTESLRSYARTDYGVELTDRQADIYRERFFRTYPGLRTWQREVSSRTWSETRTLGGRRRLVTNSTSYTQILNTPIQGTGADGLKAAIALLWERREACPDATLVLAIHDELVVEVPTEKASAAKAWLEAALKDGMQPLIAPVPVELETTIRVSESA